MTTRGEYHDRRVQRAIANVIQHFYNIWGDEDTWLPFVFEEEQKCINSAKERVNKEDGFPPDFVS